MESIKGFKDWTGEEALKREQIKTIISNTFNLYGYSPAETPIIENRKFVIGDNKDDEAVSDIYKLKDKGDRDLALRYEFTFQLKRLAKNKKLPFKRYQIGPLFRDEPVGPNRYRQFTQCDVDIVGSTIKDEAEILKITNEILKKLNINAIININNRKLINEILEEFKVKEKNKEQVIREIDKLDKLTEKEIISNLKKFKAEKILSIFKKPEKYFEKYKSYFEIKELKKYCKLYGVKINFKPTLARGLSYYNGSIYEVDSKDLKGSICGGGSYKINNIQSTGISFGIERLSSIAKLESKTKKILIISLNQDKEAIKLTAKFREQNIPCSIFYGKPSKALDYANSYNINYVIFIGEEEVKENKIKVKDMKTGKEKTIKITELKKTFS